MAFSQHVQQRHHLCPCGITSSQCLCSPQRSSQSTKENVFGNPLDRRQTQTAPGGSPYATYGCLKPTYTKEQLNEIKPTCIEVGKLKYIRSLGNSDAYLKFDFTLEGFVSNVGNGLVVRVTWLKQQTSLCC